MVMQFPEMGNLSYPYFDIATHHFTLPKVGRVELGQNHLEPTGLHTGLFFGGGTHISAASRGSSGMLPQKSFVFYVGL